MKTTTFSVLMLLLAACSPATGPGDAGDAGADRPVDAGPPVVTDVTLTTSDAVSIDATFYAPAAVIGAPTVLLVHQYLLDKDQWGDLPADLNGRGYAVLAISLRGHGASDAYGGGALSGILTDPNGAPRDIDIDAAIAWLDDEVAANSDRLAIVGTSIGANLVVASAVANKATTYVAVSPREAPSAALAGAPVASLTSVFFVAGENDSGDQAADSTRMYGLTSDPRELQIYAGSAAHGVDIFSTHGDDFLPRLMTWLEETL